MDKTRLTPDCMDKTGLLTDRTDHRLGVTRVDRAHGDPQASDQPVVYHVYLSDVVRVQYWRVSMALAVDHGPCSCPVRRCACSVLACQHGLGCGPYSCPVRRCACSVLACQHGLGSRPRSCPVRRCACSVLACQHGLGSGPWTVQLPGALSDVVPVQYWRVSMALAVDRTAAPSLRLWLAVPAALA